METTQEKLFHSCICYPVAKVPGANNGVRMQQKLLFEFFTNIGASTHKVK